MKMTNEETMSKIMDLKDYLKTEGVSQGTSRTRQKGFKCSNRSLGKTATKKTIKAKICE